MVIPRATQIAAQLEEIAADVRLQKDLEIVSSHLVSLDFSLSLSASI